MTRRAIVLTAILLVVLLGGAVYLHVLVRRVSIQPPPHGEEVARTRLTEAALQSTSKVNETARLYFPAYDQGVLLEEKRQIAWAETETDRIRQVLLALIEGSQQGPRRALPPSAAVRAVFLAPDGTAYLDFSRQTLTDFRPGIESECFTVYSIVNSVTANISAVKRVRILVEGQEVETLDGHVDLTDYFVPDMAPVQAGP